TCPQPRIATLGRKEPRFTPLVYVVARVPVLVGLVVEVLEGVGHVALLLRALDLLMEGLEHASFDERARLLVDRVADVRVEPRAPALVLHATIRAQALAAVVAEARTQVVLAAAGGATIAQLSAGHCDEESVRALDDLQVADHDEVVDRDAGEGAQLVRLVLEQL